MPPSFGQHVLTQHLPRALLVACLVAVPFFSLSLSLSLALSLSLSDARKHGRPASNNCAAMDVAPPQHSPAGVPLPPPPSVANEHLKRMLPPCTAPEPTERWSAARKRSRHVECAHDNDGTATTDEVVLHRQYLALVEARSVAGTPYAAPTNTQLAAQMQQMQQQIQQQMQQQIQQQMQQQMQQIQQQMQQMHVRQMNAWSYRATDVVANFPNNAMEPAPGCFPSTFEALKCLNSSNCGACLQYYGLPRSGSLDARRHRLATHLGVRLDNNVFQALEDRLDGLDRHQQRSEARQRNFGTWQAGDAIVPFRNDAGDPLPASFPATQQDLLDLPEDDLNELNSYYGIDGGGKRKLAHFLGVPSRSITNDQFT